MRDFWILVSYVFVFFCIIYIHAKILPLYKVNNDRIWNWCLILIIALWYHNVFIWVVLISLGALSIRLGRLGNCTYRSRCAHSIAFKWYPIYHASLKYSLIFYCDTIQYNIETLLYYVSQLSGRYLGQKYIKPMYTRKSLYLSMKWIDC